MNVKENLQVDLKKIKQEKTSLMIVFEKFQQGSEP